MKKRMIIVSCLVVILVMAIFTYVHTFKERTSATPGDDEVLISEEENKSEEIVYKEPLVKYE